MNDWRIEPLEPRHERSDFSCGKRPLDDFFRSLVTQYEKRKLGRTYVLVHEGEVQVFGYYTLAAGAVAFQNIPTELARKLPRHPVPVILLARLAVDQSVQGRRLGKVLLIDALRKFVALATSLGVFAVEVLAIDPGAKSFYEKFGFVSLLDDERHLFLPIRTIEQAIEAKYKPSSGLP